MKRYGALILTLCLLLAVAAACSGPTASSVSESASSDGDNLSSLVSAISSSASHGGREGDIDRNVTADLSMEAYADNSSSMGRLMVHKSTGDTVLYTAESDVKVYGPMWSPDGKYIAFQVFEGGDTALMKVFLCRLSDGKVWDTGGIVYGTRYYGTLRYYQWSADSSRLLICGPTPAYWDVKAEALQPLPLGGGASGMAAFSADGSKIAIAILSKTAVSIRLYNAAAGTTSDSGSVPIPPDNGMNSGPVQPFWISESEIVTACPFTTVFYKVNLTTGAVGEYLDASQLTPSPDGKYIAYPKAANGGRSMVIRTVATGAEVSIPLGFDDPASAVWSGGRLILYSSSVIKVYGMDGAQVGDTVKGDIGPSAPVFTSGGLWYEKNSQE